MTLTRDQLLVFAAAAALRLVIFAFFPDLQAYLTHRVEISTPVTSFKRCKSDVREVRLKTYAG